MGIYAAITVASIILNFIRSALFYLVCVNASRVLHNRMFGAIIRAPVRFFDTNPSGESDQKTSLGPSWWSKNYGRIGVLPPWGEEAVKMIYFIKCGLSVMYPSNGDVSSLTYQHTQPY